MKKILLCAVNTKYIHSNPAVYLLQAYALQHFPEARSCMETAEFTINNRSDEILAAIFEKQPDVVLFSCYIWNRMYIEQIIPDLHALLPTADLWLGGPEVSFDAEKILTQFPQLKGILIGEGEETFSELSGNYYLKKNKELSGISGLVFRDDDKIVTTKDRELLCMDEIPFIYHDENAALFDHKILYYESSRGCPFRCSYCLSSVDKSVRFRNAETVCSELQYFLDRKVPQVKFVDRTFNIDPVRTARLLQYIADHDNGVTNFHFEMAGDLLTDQELKIMEHMRPGLIQLEIGVQSTNPDTLKAIHRVCDFSRLKSVVSRILQASNIHIHLDLIAGLPCENYDSFSRSFNEVYAMEPSQLQLGFLKVLKGSLMQAQAKDFGIVYRHHAPYEVLSTRWISFAELLRLKRIEEMVELYYNSRQFTAAIKVLETQFGSAFEMFEKIAEYYKERGYFTNSPSRIYRYQILLEFVRSCAPEQERLFRELLTFDLYFRENLKSRPEFAPDQKQYREILHRFRSDRRLHAEAFHYPVHWKDPRSILTGFREKPYILLFDYEKRDPLDHNAAVSEIEADC